MEKEIKIGINYFCGWWREQPNKWTVEGKDWRYDYPERVPLLGCFNGAETMEAEIAAASSYGVDFFIMLWYNDDYKHDNVEMLNRCFDDFKNAKNNSSIKFMAEYCNHPPFTITEDSIWEEKCNKFVDFMKHPSYMKADGKSLFKVHGLHYFFEECGRDFSRLEGRINYLRKLAESSGVGKLLISAGVMSSGITAEEEKLSKYFDYLCSYADVPDLAPKEKPYSYRLLEAQAIYGRKIHATGNYTYMPYIMSGWDPRPWKDARAAFKQPTEKQWKRTLSVLKKDFDKYPSLGLPKDGGGRIKVFNIYAWNEYGEGGYMAPTLKTGYMKLEILKKIFGD